jgi:hypothetical protein
MVLFIFASMCKLNLKNIFLVCAKENERFKIWLLHNFIIICHYRFSFEVGQDFALTYNKLGSRLL